MRTLRLSSFSLALVVTLGSATAQEPGEARAITPPRVTQDMITSGALSFEEVRQHGLRMFATAFNKYDGYGDGPMSDVDPISPGGRPTLQNNGTFLRVNGLDAQTCVECHSILSTATVPFRLGIGGIGGANNNAIFQPREIDVADNRGWGYAAFDGRFINPPFLFGAGGVELVAKEMTRDLQQLKAVARRNPGRPVPLITKGVSFGALMFQNGAFNTSGVEGIEHDLVVRPFGRKGEFATTRGFDRGAMMFHFGMQPQEDVGKGVDADNDGVVDEILIGELSALAVFTTTLERPNTVGRANRGERLFRKVGCAECHVPELNTQSPMLTYSFPEASAEPDKNIYYAADLRRPPANFDRSVAGGIRVPMFSDLKRHDMGPGLAESTGHRLDRFFITARLWGIADTAPYLHDGRALTLTDAILQHGGEAQSARDTFEALGPKDRIALLTFLRTLRTPTTGG